MVILLSFKVDDGEAEVVDGAIEEVALLSNLPIQYDGIMSQILFW